MTHPLSKATGFKRAHAFMPDNVAELKEKAIFFWLGFSSKVIRVNVHT